jgi:hypothetical protein
LRKFFGGPGILELRNAPIPSSTTEPEIEARKRDLRFRIDLLRAVLDLAQGELRSLGSGGKKGQ